MQTFFLATQEKGYYVLNDTFRYLQDPTKSHSADYPVSDASANGTPQQYAMQHEVCSSGIVFCTHSAHDCEKCFLPFDFNWLHVQGMVKVEFNACKLYEAATSHTD